MLIIMVTRGCGETLPHTESKNKNQIEPKPNNIRYKGTERILPFGRKIRKFHIT